MPGALRPSSRRGASTSASSRTAPVPEPAWPDIWQGVWPDIWQNIPDRRPLRFPFRKGGGRASPASGAEASGRACEKAVPAQAPCAGLCRTGQAGPGGRGACRAGRAELSWKSLAA